jgi:hypothetical protein
MQKMCYNLSHILNYSTNYNTEAEAESVFVGCGNLFGPLSLSTIKVLFTKDDGSLSSIKGTKDDATIISSIYNFSAIY